MHGDLELSGHGICCNENGSPEFAPSEEDKDNEVGRVQKEPSSLDMLWLSRLESEATSKCCDRA